MTLRKVVLLILILAFALPGITQAQSENLSQAEISRISNSVVLIYSLDRSGDVESSGSGTIMTPNGQIYTNRHVVENGEDFAILVIEDIAEQPVLRYFATPILIDDNLDFAILQIDRDAEGRRIDSNTLNLPVITMSSAPPSIGDRIFVFGFPGIGDGFLVLTSGSITTIQNDTLNGERIPFLYQTDAQISPGNSGGLAVNSSGNMIGIPTQVNSEERTLGRLGGILSVSAIRFVLDSPIASAPTNEPFLRATQPPSNNAGDAEITIAINDVEQNVEQDGTVGMIVHTNINAIGYRGATLRIAIFAFWEDGSPIIANSRAANSNRTDEGQLTSQQLVTPGFDNTIYDDLWFFIPYSLFPDGETGTASAYVEAQIGVDGETFTAFSNLSSFLYTFSDQQLIVSISRIEHNTTEDGESGMKVYGYINIIGYRSIPVRVALFLYWESGEPIDGSEAPTDFQTSDGALTVQDVVTPSFDNSEWEEFWFFVPYAYFPTGLTGALDAYAQLEIGVDGETFNSWSLTELFTLNY